MNQSIIIVGCFLAQSSWVKTPFKVFLGHHKNRPQNDEVQLNEYMVSSSCGVRLCDVEKSETFGKKNCYLHSLYAVG